jgi:hypothetical protein
MQLPQPFLFTSPRMIAMVDREYIAPGEGLVADPVYGYHSLWIAEVPFIPAYVGKEERDFATEASNRLTRMHERLVRFLYDLAQTREHLSTFELRLVSWPQPQRQARVGLAFLGKAFHQEEAMSRRRALELWDKFSAIFPREAPFSYPLVPVQHVEETAGKHYARSFRTWFEPLPFEGLVYPQSIVELRKYEDWPTVRDVGGVLHARDYIAHPFVPALDYSAMARLFETLARQTHVCLVAITLRPQRLTDQEMVILHELASWYQRAARGEVVINNPLVDVLKELQSDMFGAYTRMRSELGIKVYENMVREQRSLFTVRLQVVGNPVAQDDVIEALGSEVMANAGNAYPSRWKRVEPHENTRDLHWARFNLQWLEFVRWGISDLICQDQRIVRLRQLATVLEVAGAFRLPVASASGGIAGIDVRDEPFSAPLAEANEPEVPLQAGVLLDRGVPTGVPFMLPLRALHGLIHVLGDASPAQERLLRSVLRSAQDRAIPWMYVLGAGHPGQDIAEALQVRHLRLDAFSSPHTLGFQPLLPPPGISLPRFLDTLIHIFLRVYRLDIATSGPLRQALTETYRQAGWTEQQTGGSVDPGLLAEQITLMARQSHLPQHIAQQLHLQCVLPLQDLALTASGFLQIPPAQDLRQCLQSACIESGWLGSDVNASLLRACLWAWLVQAYTLQANSSGLPRALICIEDAQSIVSAPAGQSSLAGVLAQHDSAARVGQLFVDNQPAVIEQNNAHAATLTMITHSSNRLLLRQAAELLGLSPRQAARLERLKPDEAFIGPRGMEPGLIVL